MIRQVGDRWVLYSHEGKILGEHPTRVHAETQEIAIKIAKLAQAHRERAQRARHDRKTFFARHQRRTLA